MLQIFTFALDTETDELVFSGNITPVEACKILRLHTVAALLRIKEDAQHRMDEAKEVGSVAR